MYYQVYVKIYHTMMDNNITSKAISLSYFRLVKYHKVFPSSPFLEDLSMYCRLRQQQYLSLVLLFW